MYTYKGTTLILDKRKNSEKLILKFIPLPFPTSSLYFPCSPHSFLRAFSTYIFAIQQ